MHLKICSVNYFFQIFYLLVRIVFTRFYSQRFVGRLVIIVQFCVKTSRCSFACISASQMRWHIRFYYVDKISIYIEFEFIYNLQFVQLTFLFYNWNVLFLVDRFCRIWARLPLNLPKFVLVFDLEAELHVTIVVPNFESLSFNYKRSLLDWL